MSELRITPEHFPHGVRCGCACECGRVLNDGNAMEQDISAHLRDPWEPASPDDIPVRLLICADCYVGNHPSPTPPTEPRL